MRRITRKDLRGLYEPAPQSLYNGIHEALASLPEGRETRKVKKKISTGFILAATLLALSVAGFAATRLNLFNSLTRFADPIVPLVGAEELVETGLGNAENEWVTVIVEEAAYDGQGVMVLAKITPKEPEKYALLNDFYMDPDENEYIITLGPDEVPEGTQEAEWMRIVNENDEQALYIDGQEVPIPEGRTAAKKLECPIYREDDRLYYTEVEFRRVVSRRDGRKILGFEPALYPKGEGADSLTDVMNSDAEVQSDGSALVWCDGYAEETLPDVLGLNLHVTLLGNCKSRRGSGK